MSFVKIWIHLVFATKNRFPFLIKENKIQIIHHIKDYSMSKEVYIDTINGGSEHLHCLISLGKEQTISNVTNLIKGESSFFGLTKIIYSAQSLIGRIDILRFQLGCLN